MNIDLLKLKQVIDRLFDHIIQTRGIKSVEVSENFYWVVPEERLCDMDNQVGELEVGSLQDDWEFISDILAKGNEPVILQLAEMAPLLHYIAVKLAKQTADEGG